MMNPNKWSEFNTRAVKYLPQSLLPDSKPDLRFIQFLIVGASGLVINNLCLVLFTELGGIHYLISSVLATQCSTLWNFTFTEVWVFGKRDSRSLSDRLIRYFLMNNAALLLRGPLLTFMVSALSFHYLFANLLSIFIFTVIRFILSDKWIWTPSQKESQNGVFAYDIHNIIGIESTIRLPELEYFLVPELGRNPDLRLSQDSGNVQSSSTQSIFYTDGLGRFGFELSMELGETTEIQASPLVRKSPHVLYTNIVEPVLRWTLARKGYALVHAACIILEGQPTLVTAETDTGKTSTVLRILENHGCEFISDDMTILDRDGRVLNFPKPLTISSHTLSALSHTTLQFRERLRLQFQSRIHSRSGRKFAMWLVSLGLPVASINAVVQILVPPPKYMVDRLIPEVTISELASLSHIIQIERGPELQENIELEEMVDILYRNAEDAYGFPPYLELSGALSTWCGEDLHPVEQQIVSSAVDGCMAWRVGSPSFGWWKKLPEVVKFDQAAIPAWKEHEERHS